MYQPRRTLILIERLQSVTSKAGTATDAELRGALKDLCVYLSDALQDPEFTFTLEKLLQAHQPRALAFDEFERFLTVEWQVLLMYGLPTSLAAEAVDEFRGLRQNLGPLPSSDTFMSTLARLRDLICGEVERGTSKQPVWLRAVKHATLSLVGGTAVTANGLIAIHLDGGFFSGISVEHGLVMAYRQARMVINILTEGE